MMSGTLRAQWRLVSGFTLFSIATFAGAASAVVAPLQVGQQAPAFSLPDQSGKIRHLSDFRGHTVVLAFYPKDFTGG